MLRLLSKFIGRERSLSNATSELIPWHLMREFTQTFEVTILALLRNMPDFPLLVMLSNLPGKLEGIKVPFGKCSMLLYTNGVGIEWLRMNSWRRSERSEDPDNFSSFGMRKVIPVLDRESEVPLKILRRMTNP